MFQFYTPNWWKLYPYYSRTLCSYYDYRDHVGNFYWFDNVFCFGALQFRWQTQHSY